MRNVLILGGGEDAAARGIGQLFEISRTMALGGADDVSVGFNGKGIAALGGVVLDPRLLVFKRVEEAFANLDGGRNDAEDGDVRFLKKAFDILEAVAAVVITAIGDQNDRGMLLVECMHFGISDRQIDGVEKRSAAFPASRGREDAVSPPILTLRQGSMVKSRTIWGLLAKRMMANS